MAHISTEQVGQVGTGRLRVAFCYPDEFGYFPDIYEYATELVARGIDVYFLGVARAGTGGERVEAGVHVLELERDRRGPRFTLLKHSGRVLSAVSPDIVHVFAFRGASGLPVLWRLPHRPCWVLDVRTIHVENRSGYLDRLSGLKDRLTWLEAQVFDITLALTEEIEHRLRPSLRPIYRIPLGAKSHSLSPGEDAKCRRDVRRKLSIPDHAVVVLYPGVLSPSRRMEILAEAFGIASEQRRDLHLVVVGPGPAWYVEKLKKIAIGSSDGSSRVHFMGSVPCSIVGRYFRAADIGISFTPSGTPYALQPPTKLLDFMASGLIGITNYTPATADLSDHGRNCFVVGDDPRGFAEAIVCAADGMDALDAMRKSARAWVRTRLWGALVDNQVLSIYFRARGFVNMAAANRTGAVSERWRIL